MEVIQWIRFILAAFFILGGIIVEFLAVLGIYRFRFVLNRMHAAAMGDTLALDMILVGVMLMEGLTFTTLKLFIVMIVFLFSSPVSSHLISRMEIQTNIKIKDECEVQNDENI